MDERPAAKTPPAAPPEQTERLSGLFDAHVDRLYRLARRLVPCADDALDLVQEAFVKAARLPQSIPSGSKDEEAWLVRVLVNIRRDQWRRERVRKRHASLFDHADARSENPERTLLIRMTVWHALDYLPPRRRAVVVMYELEGISIPAIASLLGISAITVRWHLSRGRRELAHRLRPQLGGTDEQPQNALAGHRPSPSRGVTP
jgi:RNA polymerase sigma-70 factor (ECF subfamily)